MLIRAVMATPGNRCKRGEQRRRQEEGRKSRSRERRRERESERQERERKYVPTVLSPHMMVHKTTRFRRETLELKNSCNEG